MKHKVHYFTVTIQSKILVNGHELELYGNQETEQCKHCFGWQDIVSLPRNLKELRKVKKICVKKS